MASLVLTQALFFLCVAVFARVFTFRRGDKRHRPGISVIAVLVMAAAGVGAVKILRGALLLPIEAWPLVVMLGVFTLSVFRAEGNLAGVMRQEPPPGWDGVDRRER